MSLLTLCSVIACFSEPFLATSGSSLARVVNANTGPNEVVYLLNNQSLLEIHPLIVKLNRPLILADAHNQWNNINADLWFPTNTLNAFVLVLCEDLWQCQRIVLDQNQRHTFNPRRKVLMQLVGAKFPGNEDEMLQKTLREVFDQFWRINLLNVVIRLGFGKQRQSFTYNPYDASFLINLNDRNDNSDNDVDARVEEWEEVYVNKAKNMQRNPFRMSLFESPPYLVNMSASGQVQDQQWIGYDGGMLNAIVKHFNATLQLVIPVDNDPGYEIYVNSTTILLRPGATQDVVEGRSDMVINTRPFTPSYLIEYLYPHYFNPVSIILPKSQKISWARSLVKVYRLDALIPIAILILIVLLLNILLHRRRRRSNQHNAPGLEILSYILLTSYKSTLNYRNSHRFLLVTWSISCIILMSVITGSMYSHVLTAGYDVDVDSVDQLMETDYRIPIIRQRYSLFQIYKRSGNQTKSGMLSDQYWRLMNKFVVYESLKEIFELIDRNAPFAFLQTRGHCRYFEARKRFAGPDGGPVFHLMKEIIVPDNAVQIVQYGSPYLEELNKLLSWFKEAGLDLYSRMRLNMQLSTPTPAREVHSLSFGNVSHAFRCYGMCLAACIVTFIAELVWKRISAGK